jgi:hypothetical protein
MACNGGRIDVYLSLCCTSVVLGSGRIAVHVLDFCVHMGAQATASVSDLGRVQQRSFYDGGYARQGLVLMYIIPCADFTMPKQARRYTNAVLAIALTAMMLCTGLTRQPWSR